MNFTSFEQEEGSPMDIQDFDEQLALIADQIPSFIIRQSQNPSLVSLNKQNFQENKKFLTQCELQIKRLKECDNYLDFKIEIEKFYQDYFQTFAQQEEVKELFLLLREKSELNKTLRSNLERIQRMNQDYLQSLISERDMTQEDYMHNVNLIQDQTNQLEILFLRNFEEQSFERAEALFQSAKEQFVLRQKIQILGEKQRGLERLREQMK